jgi:two-component system, chemotaxis family, chemotaxis protein CheY
MSLKSNILITEDHDAARFLLGATLKKDFHVVTKKDGLEAMAWLASGNIPDLIVLDMNMPRLGGIDFLKQIKNSGMYKEIPVLIVSSNEDEDEILQCFALGVWGFFLKPFNPILLKEKITHILRKPTTNLN